MTIKDYDKILTHYKLLRPLGQGGMGEVFLAQDLLLDRYVAVKFLKVNSTTENQIIQKRFQNEAKILASLDHPNIVRIFNFGVSGGINFIVMEYVEGKTLSEIIERGPIRVDQAIKVLRRLVRGIRQAHESAILHRDIKPANIILTAKKDVKIVDFGISKSFVSDDHNYTRDDHFIGTMNYIAPEILVGQSPTMMSDIFSIGIIFYEMVTQVSPFKGKNQFETIENIKTMNLKLPKSIEVQLPVGFLDIFTSMIARSPKDRCQSSSILYEQLKSIDLKVTEASGKSAPKREEAPAEALSLSVEPVDNIVDDEVLNQTQFDEEVDLPLSLRSAVKTYNGSQSFEGPKIKKSTGVRPLFIIGAILAGVFFGMTKSAELLVQLKSFGGIQEIPIVNSVQPIENNEKQRLPAQQSSFHIVEQEKEFHPVLDFPPSGGEFKYETQLINDDSGKIVSQAKYTIVIGQTRGGILRSSIKYTNGEAGVIESGANNFVPPVKTLDMYGVVKRNKISGSINKIYPLELGKKMNFSQMTLKNNASFVSHDFECKVVQVFNRTVKVSDLKLYQVRCEELMSRSPKVILTDYSPELRQTVRKETRYLSKGQNLIEIVDLIDFTLK